MRPIDEYRTTTNRSVYNRLQKQVYERRGLIRCSFDGYHSGENQFYKDYMNWVDFNDRVHVKKPSWKLCSKNRRQWMHKRHLKLKVYYTSISLEQDCLIYVWD